MADMPVQCGGCGAHFMLDPSGDVAGTACSECGGTRFFRHQPSPTQSDGTLRNMVDSDSQKDEGGNPLGEGPIMGRDGEQSLAAGSHQRDNFMHGHVGRIDDSYPVDPRKVPQDQGQWMEQWPIWEQGQDNPHNLPAANIPFTGDEGGEINNPLNFIHPEDEQMLDNGMFPPPNTKGALPSNQYLPTGYQHNDPRWSTVMTPNVSLSHRDMRPPTLNMEPYPGLWSDEHVAGTYHEAIFGIDLPSPSSIFNTVKDVGQGALQGAKDVITNPVVDAGAADLFAGAQGGLDPAADALAGSADATAAGSVASDVAPSLMNRVMNGVGQVAGNPVVKGLSGMHTINNAENEFDNLTGQGAPAPGAAPGGGSGYAMPSSAVPLQQLGAVDIPWLILADMETPHSVKSVDEQHDDPEKQDQKEFNDGDKSPSNMENPNNEDSGASGEDGVRQDTPGYGFGPDSPGIQRMMELMPLLMHYINNGMSGADDPVIQGLHQALEQEHPDYMKHEHPNGGPMVEMMIQQHNDKQPKGIHARLNARLADLTPVPMPGSDVQPQATAICPRCGSIMTPRPGGGSVCPQCGYQTGPMDAGVGGPSMPPPLARVASGTQGPNTPEQIAAVQQYLMSKPHLRDQVPDVPIHPENYAHIMNEIQGVTNTAPLVDPSQAQPAPMQPPPGGAQPGGMPMPDPAAAGAGGAPMQPMARTADANNVIPRCPKCNSASTTYTDGNDNGNAVHKGRCHSCFHVWKLPENKEARKVDARYVLTEINPITAPAADQNLGRPQEGQQMGDPWKDAQGAPLVQGQIYSLVTQGIPAADEVEIVFKKPHELGLKLVGEFGNIQTQTPGDEQAPDFVVHIQDVTSGKYTFEPSEQPSSADNGMPPLGGTPGLPTIPDQAPTTDQTSDTYPNPGTVSSYLAAGEEDYMEPDEDMCHKCGGTWIEHIASSPTRTMHECARCGTAWETADDDMGHTSANANLDWIMGSSDPYGDDFFAEYERAQGMQEHMGGAGRNIRDAAAKDHRLALIRDRLAQNGEERNQRLAGRRFSPQEQRALINEHGRARNSDMLDLAGTHYEARTQYDPRGRVNADNVPDGHLIFSL